MSKGGQGAKTSILYFEKGQPTDCVWYYKIENDGFSMGTNRKPIEGSQIPQLLEIFKVIKQGKKPKDTKHSFCIPKEWIETLDPRLAERIKKEVKERFTEKNKAKREKLLASLDEKLAKGKLSREMHDEKLWQFDNVVESQIDNEITKAIEKANSYHFNLQNYRSNLSEEQIKEWRSVCHPEQIPHGHSERSEESQGLSIEKRYQELKTADPKTALKILASFDPQNALQMDIAREYLSKLGKKILKQNEKLAKIFEILKETKQFPFKSLKNLLTSKSNKITLDDDTVYKQITIKLYGKGVLLRQEILGADIKTEGQYLVNAGDFIMSKIDARNGAFGIVPDFLEGAVVTSSFPYFEISSGKVNPKYLEAIVTQKSFYEQINNMVSGATGRRSVEVNDFLELQIPLPPLDVQNEIVENIERQKQIIEGAERIEESWKINIPFDSNIYQKVEIGSLVETSMYGTSNKAEYQESGYPVLRIGNIGFCGFDLSDIKNVELEAREFEKLKLNKDDFLIVRSNGNPDLVGKCAVWDRDDSYVYASYLIRFIFDTSKINPRYAMYYFMSPEGRVQLTPKQGGGTYNINSEEFKKFPIPLPALEIQRRIVEKLDRQMLAISGVRLLNEEAEKRIEEILTEVWEGKL